MNIMGFRLELKGFGLVRVHCTLICFIFVVQNIFVWRELMC